MSWHEQNIVIVLWFSFFFHMFPQEKKNANCQPLFAPKVVYVIVCLSGFVPAFKSSMLCNSMECVLIQEHSRQT